VGAPVCDIRARVRGLKSTSTFVARLRHVGKTVRSTRCRWSRAPIREEERSPIRARCGVATHERSRGLQSTDPGIRTATVPEWWKDRGAPAATDSGHTCFKRVRGLGREERLAPGTSSHEPPSPRLHHPPACAIQCVSGQSNPIRRPFPPSHPVGPAHVCSPLRHVCTPVRHVWTRPYTDCSPL